MAFSKTRSIGIGAMPNDCHKQMQVLGENIRRARLRRRIRQEDMAERIAISVKTYRKIENGDPSVAIGLYLSTLYMLELNKDFSLLAAPEKDVIGLALEKRSLPDRVRLKIDKELDF